jgi:hypothetical protein
VVRALSLVNESGIKGLKITGEHGSFSLSHNGTHR